PESQSVHIVPLGQHRPLKSGPHSSGASAGQQPPSEPHTSFGPQQVSPQSTGVSDGQQLGVQAESLGQQWRLPQSCGALCGQQYEVPRGLQTKPPRQQRPSPQSVVQPGAKHCPRAPQPGWSAGQQPKEQSVEPVGQQSGLCVLQKSPLPQQTPLPQSLVQPGA